MDFPLVDTHLHVWDPSLLRYHWLDDYPVLNRPYLLRDYDAACGPVAVDKMVFVQAEVARSQSGAEANWVTTLVREHDRRIAGIVPWAPLEFGAAARRQLSELAQNPLVKGIRRSILGESDRGLLLRTEFIRGVQLLPDYGLHFELCVDHVQMADAAELVRQCPHVTFVLDHTGLPDVKHRVLEPWRTQIRALSRCLNVWCKVSGLATQADREHWTRTDLKPYIDHAIDCFGFDRVMYGSDWPVATLATEYPRWVETLEWAVTGCSDEELRRLFRENALAFYRLE